MKSNKFPLIFIFFFIALAIRIIIFIPFYNAPLNIVDEQSYHGLAVNYLQNHVYGDDQRPSAMRPPLYPFFLSLIYKITGKSDNNSVKALQILISVFTAFILYQLFKDLFDENAATNGSILFLFYPSLIFFNYLVLSETIFIFIFVLFFYFISKFLTNGSVLLSIFSGLLLGISSLTRSITYPLAVPIAVLISILLFKEFRMKSFFTAVLFLLSFSAAILPWMMRNYQVFGTFVPIDTMGGLNLHMGNFEHTPTHRSWAAVEMTDENAWYRGHEVTLKNMNEAEKQKWAIQKAKEYVKLHLGQTFFRSIIKAANFWGLERTIIAGMEKSYFSYFSGKWFRFIIYALILLAYAGVVVAGISGLILKVSTAPARFDVVFIFILLAFTGIHSIVFGHSRYHLPLVPFLCGYAGWLSANLQTLKKSNRKQLSRTGIAVTFFFCCIWIYEVLIGSYEKITTIIGS